MFRVDRMAPQGAIVASTSTLFNMRRIVLAATTLVCAAAPRVASAQSFPTDDPVLKRIWAIGMDSTRTYQLSQTLFDSIGPRLMGSPNIKGAEDWLVSTY